MWLQIKTSIGPYVFRSQDLKTIAPVSNTVLRFVFENSNIQPKPADVWVEFTHTAGKGNDIVDLFWEWTQRDWKKDLLRPVVLADKVNSIYFSNEISACKITGA
tara:strand:- start:8925 stop:9236 length:312 start_codon:yes stop_codon:yes gene_type:complete